MNKRVAAIVGTQLSFQTNPDDHPTHKKDMSQKHSPSPLFDKCSPMPHNLDAEKALLCCLLRAPRSILSKAAYGVSEKHFHDPAHRIIFHEIAALEAANCPIDIASLTECLENNGDLEDVGGPQALFELMNFLKPDETADPYIDILKEMQILREIKDIGSEVVAMASSGTEDAHELLEHIRERIHALGTMSVNHNAVSVKEILFKAIELAERQHNKGGGVSGLSTGFAGLDTMTGGLRPSEMILIAGQASIGKSALAMNIAEHVAVTIGKPVGVFSLQMSGLQLGQRLLCSHSRVSLNRLRDGGLSRAEVARITKSNAVLSKCEILIDDTTELTLTELRRRARQMKQISSVSLIIIDDIHLLRDFSHKGREKRQRELAAISRGIKAMTKELKVPVIVVAQLNREPESFTIRCRDRPSLGEFRKFGGIERDADVVALLMRNELSADDPKEQIDFAMRADLMVAKQRNGTLGSVPLNYLKEVLRFEDRVTAGS